MADENKNISIRLVADIRDLQSKLREVDKNLKDTLNNTGSSQTPAAVSSFKALEEALRQTKNMAGETTASLGRLAPVLQAMGPYGKTAALGLGLVVLSLGSLVKVAGENEQIQRRLQTQIEATGYRAGLTAGQINDYAEQLSRSTGIADNAFKQAATTLAAYGDISGDMFKQILELAADYSAAFGGELTASTEKLAIAMQKLGSGNVEKLRQSFTFLTVAQEDLIQSFIRSGDTVKAQQALLDALRGTIGNAAEADADTLYGSFRALGTAFGSFIDSIADLAPIRALTGALTGLNQAVTAGLNSVTQWINGESGAALDQKIASLQARIAELDAAGRDRGFDGWVNRNWAASTREELEPLLARQRQEREAAAQAEAEAEADRRARVESFLADEERKAEAQQRLAQMTAQQRSVEQKVDEARQRAQREGIVLTAEQEQQIRATAQRTVELEGAQKSGTDTAQKYGNAQRELVEALGLEEDAQSRLLEAYQQGTQAGEAMRRTLDAENRVRQAGIVLNSAEGRAMIERIRHVQELGQAVEETTETQQQAARAAQQYAEEQRRILEQPFENAISSIQSQFGNFFESLFSGGVKSFSDLAGAAKSIFIRLAAELATIQFFRSTGLVGSVAGAAGVAGGATGGSAGIGGLLNFGSSLYSNLGSGIGNFSLFGTSVNQLGASLGFGYGPGTSALVEAGLAPSGAGSLTSASLGGVLGAAGLGFAGGGLLAGLLGMNSTGGSIGGGLGAAIGSMVMPGIGTLLGGIAGGLLGGLFGNSKPTNAAAFGTVDFNAGTSSYSHMNKGGSAENMKLLQQGFDAVLQFSQAFNQLGVGQIAGKISGIDAGTRDTQSAYVNGVKVEAAAGQFGQLAINALKEALKQTVIGNTDVKTALSNASYTDLNQTISDVQFAAGFQDSLKAYRDGLTAEIQARQQAAQASAVVVKQLTDFLSATQRTGLDMTSATEAVSAALKRLHDGEAIDDISAVQQAIIGVTEQMKGMEPVLTKLGYTASQVQQWISEATSNGIAALRTQFGKNIDDQIQQISDPQSYALAQLDAQFDAIRADATLLGVDLAKIEQLYGLKRQQIVEQVNSAMVNSTIQAGQKIQQWLDAQRLGSLSSLNPMSKLAEAQSQFSSAVDLARGGNAAALGGITGNADTLLSAARGVYASSADYALIEQMVRSTLEGLGRTLGLPGFAAGTDHAPPGMAWVGESGPELVRLRGGERIHNASTSRAIAQTWDNRPIVQAVGDLRRDSAQDTLALISEVRQLRRDISDLNGAVRRVVAR